MFFRRVTTPNLRTCLSTPPEVTRRSAPLAIFATGVPMQISGRQCRWKSEQAREADGVG